MIQRRISENNNPEAAEEADTEQQAGTTAAESAEDEAQRDARRIITQELRRIEQLFRGNGAVYNLGFELCLRLPTVPCVQLLLYPCEIRFERSLGIGAKKGVLFSLDFTQKMWLHSKKSFFCFLGVLVKNRSFTVK